MNTHKLSLFIIFSKNNVKILLKFIFIYFFKRNKSFVLIFVIKKKVEIMIQGLHKQFKNLLVEIL